MTSTSLPTLARRAAALADPLPCGRDPGLWFSESPADLDLARASCLPCPLRAECLASAIERAEPWGVWGGEIFDRGAIIARKRPRGRPPRHLGDETDARSPGTTGRKSLRHHKRHRRRVCARRSRAAELRCCRRSGQSPGCGTRAWRRSSAGCRRSCPLGRRQGRPASASMAA